MNVSFEGRKAIDCWAPLYVREWPPHMLGDQVSYITKKKKKKTREEKREEKKLICPYFINKMIPLHLRSDQIEIWIRGLKLE